MYCSDQLLSARRLSYANTTAAAAHGEQSEEVKVTSIEPLLLEVSEARDDECLREFSTKIF